MTASVAMPRQLPLPEFATEPGSTDASFFAVLPELGARFGQLAQQLKRERGLRGRPLANHRFHVSLHLIDTSTGLSEGAVAAAGAAAEMVTMPPFTVEFDRVINFNRALVLIGDDGVVGLRVLHQRLATALRTVGLGHRIRGSFTPHVTLLYGEQTVPEQPVEPLRWTVREFVLIHSLVGKTQHILLGRWPLRS